MYAKKAFTLIELLVVIAIIAILAAILFPVFAQAKAAAKKSVAVSNAKQLALGIVMYGNDYDDTLPMAQSYGYNTNLPIELAPYVQKVKNNYMGESGTNDGSNIWHDPADLVATQRKQSWAPIYWTGGGTREAAWGTYAASPTGGGYIPGRSMTAFPAPADTFVLAETANDQALLGTNFAGVKRAWEPVGSTFPGNAGANPSGAYFGQDCKKTDGNGVCTALMDKTKPAGFHQEGWVYAYADGHSKFLKAIATVGKGVNGTGKDADGRVCSGGFSPCGPWTLDDQD